MVSARCPVFRFRPTRGDSRRRLFGRAGWEAPVSETPATLAAAFCSSEDMPHAENKIPPYLAVEDAILHPALLKWIDQHIDNNVVEIESPLDQGIRNILAHGNSLLRQNASVALSQLKCVGRLRSGGGGIRRITWGSPVMLDD